MSVAIRVISFISLSVMAAPLSARQVGFLTGDDVIYRADPGSAQLEQAIPLDFNRDGRLDYLVLRNYYSGLDTRFSTIQVLMNQGGDPPAFGEQIIYQEAEHAQHDMSLADFDGDGDEDVLYTWATTLTETYNSIGWLENTDGIGGAWLDRGLITSAFASAASSAAGDIDRDGDIDFVTVGKTADNKTGWMANSGDGAHFYLRELPYTNTLNRVALGDVDLDGDLDIVATDRTNSLLIAFLNNGANPPGFNAEIISNSYNFYHLKVGDFTGDRGADVVGFVLDTEGRCFTRSSSGWTSAVLSDLAKTPYVGDLDRDGRLDLMAGDQSGSMKCAQSVPTANAWRSWSMSGIYLQDATIVDQDRDGDNDIALIDGNGLRLMTAFNLDPRPKILFGATPHVVASSAPGVRSFVVAPFSRDRFPDVAAALYAGDNIQSYLGFGYESFNFDTGRIALSGTGADGVQSIAVGDIDRDGMPDLVSAANGSGELRFLKQAGLNEPAPFLGYLISTVAGMKHTAIGDISGDGKLDIVATAQTCEGSPIPTCTGRLITYRQLSNPTVPAGWSKVIVDESFTDVGKLALADVDHDGDMDIVVGRRTTSAPPIQITSLALHWFENNGEATAFTRHTIATSLGGGVLPEAFIICDVDGDSNVDVISTDFTGDGVVWYENANGDGSTWTNHPVLSSFDTIKGIDAADVDQDGDIDLLVSSYGDDLVVVAFNNGDSWQTSEIDHTEIGPWGVRFSDMNDDGFADVVVGFETSGKILWYENQQNQCGVNVVDAAPAAAGNGGTIALARIEVENTEGSGGLNYQLGDAVLFSVRDAYGSLLTGDEARYIFANVALYHDEDGNGVLSAGDRQLGVFDSFLARPVDTEFSLPHTNPSIPEAAAPGETTRYFVTTTFKSSASIQPGLPFSLVLKDTGAIPVEAFPGTQRGIINELIHQGAAFETRQVEVLESVIGSESWTLR